MIAKSGIPVLTDSSYLLSSWFREIVAGIKRKSAEQKLKPKIFLIESDGGHDIAFDAMPDTVIVTGSNRQMAQILVRVLEAAGKRIVLAGLDVAQFGYHLHSVSISSREQTDKIMRYYRNCGRRRVALYGFWRKSSNDMSRLKHILASAAGLDLPVSEDDCYCWDRDFDECKVFWEQVFQYDAVICPTDIIGVCFLAHARRRGITVPGDLYVAGSSTRKVGQYSEPSLTTVATDYSAIGECAYSAWRTLETGQLTDAAIHITVPSSLMVRGSTAFEPDLPSRPAPSAPVAHEDAYYTNPEISTVIRLENCLSSLDSLDRKILTCIIDAKSYETMAEELFTSVGTIQYRAKKLFSEAGFFSRRELEEHFRTYLPNLNALADE